MKGQPLVAQIPWAHNVLLVQRIAECAGAYEMQADFEAKVEEHFNRMIDGFLAVGV